MMMQFAWLSWLGTSLLLLMLWSAMALLPRVLGVGILSYRSAHIVELLPRELSNFGEASVVVVCLGLQLGVLFVVRRSCFCVLES